MLKQDSIEVLRECEARLIPSGVEVTIKKGSLVVITQALGNSYTVYVNGNLARVAGIDGDALGMVILDEPDINDFNGTLEDKIWEVLKTCFDPEIPVNIVDLGLVYECHIDENFGVHIKMTLTAPGCGMGPTLVSDIEQKIRQIHEVIEIKVDLVFDPPWNRSMMTDVAKLQLGML
ncbi:MAG TPA: putative Fe-S cluster assembly protein SufT [Gammaproteobacteria bacterium]|jgi:probable FeS assembly SUF system protein SufT|nr:putative Fe-S cluster assembly protein SufT [Gammaproteobacteria bacterium]